MASNCKFNNGHDPHSEYFGVLEKFAYHLVDTDTLSTHQY